MSDQPNPADPPDPPKPPEPPEPLELRVVADAAAFKAMSDPLRLRLLEVLGSDPQRLWTVKELAAELRQPVTKLYHHMKLLENAALVVDAETRLVSGIVEHRYRSAQRSIKLDERLFGQRPFRDDAMHSMVGIVEQARDELVRYLQTPEPVVEQVSIGRALARLSPEEYAEAQQHLEAVIDTIAARRTDRDRAGLPRVAITILAHPVAEAH